MNMIFAIMTLKLVEIRILIKRWLSFIERPLCVLKGWLIKIKKYNVSIMKTNFVNPDIRQEQKQSSGELANNEKKPNYN